MSCDVMCCDVMCHVVLVFTGEFSSKDIRQDLNRLVQAESAGGASVESSKSRRNS